MQFSVVRWIPSTFLLLVDIIIVINCKFRSIMVFHRCSRPIGTAIFIALMLTATVLSGAEAAVTEQHGTQDGHEETTQDAFSFAHGEETPYVRGSRHGNVADLDGPSQPANGELGGTTQGERVLKQTNDLTSVPGSVMVKYRKGLSEANRANIRSEVSAIKSKKLSKLADDWEVIKVKKNTDLKKLIEKLQKKTSEIEYAELDYWLTTVVDANDPNYEDGSLWGMYGSNTSPNTNPYGCQAGSAWAKGFQGSSNVVIGIIDEGIDVEHTDLQGNIWINPNEIAGNGLDDDGNGKVDDVNGWDFFYDDATVFDGSDNHGTHVAGTIGATGNNQVGVVGVNWNVNMISAKFLGPNGGSTSDAADAIDYLTYLKVNHGVNIVASNNSWGGGGFNQALLEAIRRGGDAGILFIASAGNAASDNDSNAKYPANYDCSKLADGNVRGWDCVVSVASITSTGALSSFSSYGAQTVDLGAPGSGILSTVPGGAYASYSGTSMATPHVSGAVALCAAANPSLTAQQIRQFLMASTEHTTSLETKTVSEGRLNVDAMMTLCSQCTVDDDCDDQNACTTGSCDAGVCHFNPIPNCCGDGVCEPGENSVDCPVDCCGSTNDCPVAPLCLTATCDSGVCGTESAGTCPGSINESNLFGDQGTEHHYQLEAPDGATSIVFQVSGGSGDADLYVKFGSAPTLTSYDCRPWTSGNDEQCTDNKSGVYHVMVRGYSSFSGVSLQGSHNGPQDNQFPSAGFTHAVTDLQVDFVDTSTDIDGTIISRLWAFGDGSESTDQNPTHTYSGAGTYTVTLEVTDDGGLRDSESQAVTTTEPSTPCTPRNQIPLDCSKCCRGRGCKGNGKCR